ncbi:MAG TPA: metallophosphoesterase, partial [bacterium]|nr:metallophosphoesterase [bacterium]
KVVPELLEWLEDDLKNTDKPYIFVAAHEPLVAMPDLNSGRIRHQDDSMNKYPKSSFRFHQLMVKYNVSAYFCGHTHGASIAKINGLWQIDGGHARGIESPFPESVYSELNQILAQNSSDKQTNQIITEYFQQLERRKYNLKKMLYYSDLTDGIYYKELEDKPALKSLKKFYKNYKSDPELKQKYIETYNQNTNLSRSTFVKIILEKPYIKVEFYRDDGWGSGKYNLMYSTYLK